jgi:hypothetical protein
LPRNLLIILNILLPPAQNSIFSHQIL